MKHCRRYLGIDDKK